MTDSWVAIDFETANADWGSACAVGLVRVSSGRITDRFTTLIRPPRPVDFFSAFNIGIHGITAEDVRDAPPWPTALERILDFAGGSPLVAHNARFDMSVVRAACGHAGLSCPPLEYACTLTVARRVWTDLPNHKLPTVCAAIGHELLRHHSADVDAEAAAHIMLAAMGRHGAGTLHDLAQRVSAPIGRLAPGDGPAPAASSAASRFGRWQEESRAVLPEPNPHAAPTGPLFGKTVCITGDLMSLPKPEAWRRIADVGGTPAKNVTKKTDVLVVGSHGGPGKTGKHRQAETYIARGRRIELISERDLTARLETP